MEEFASSDANGWASEDTHSSNSFETHPISAWTTTEEVEENARHLIEEVKDDLQVAFEEVRVALYQASIS
jgi:hypothetical protein